MTQHKNGATTATALPAASTLPLNGRVKRNARNAGVNAPPPPAPNRWRKGQSGNPSGKPKLLSEAYRVTLQYEYPQEFIAASKSLSAQVALVGKEGQPITYAEAIALDVAYRAANGDIPAARELARATEGDRLTILLQNEMSSLLRQGTLTPQELIEELGLEEARTFLLASGIGLEALGMHEQLELPAGLQTVEGETVEPR